MLLTPIKLRKHGRGTPLHLLVFAVNDLLVGSWGRFFAFVAATFRGGRLSF
jgi:hypothetical protein